MIWSGKNTQRKYAMAATFARKYVTYPQDCEGDVNDHKRRKMESFVTLLHTSTLSELCCWLFCCVDVILPRSPLHLPSLSSILPHSCHHALKYVMLTTTVCTINLTTGKNVGIGSTKFSLVKTWYSNNNFQRATTIPFSSGAWRSDVSESYQHKIEPELREWQWPSPPNGLSGARNRSVWHPFNETKLKSYNSFQTSFSLSLSIKNFHHVLPLQIHRRRPAE